MAVSVQFRDKETAIEAFKNVEVEAWSVWQNKQMLFKGIGETDLDAFLEMLSQHSTNAIYTVKYYEDISDKKKIKENTPADGSFNFKLNADTQEINGAQYGVIRHNNELASRLGAVENKFDALLDQLSKVESEEDEPEPNRLGIIGDILGHPAIAPMIPQLLSVLMGSGTPTPPAQRIQYTPATVGNIEDQQLKEAIEKLKQYDNRLADHLMKLAKLAETDNATFNMVIKSLDAY